MNEHEINEGDIILVYSDGFSDNVYNQGFIPCIEKQLVNGLIQSYGTAADCLSRKAYFLGKNMYYKSPFAQGALKAGPQFAGSAMGGKHDDITVTVA